MRTLSFGQATRAASRSRSRQSGKTRRRDPDNSWIEALLPRRSVGVGLEEARAIVDGKVVLVTGAGGSIGTELCRQIASANPQRLLLLDKSENGLFYVNLEVSERLARPRVVPYLADVLDRDRVSRILLHERPNIVFHAAAHKHVVMLEMHPQEAIRNNVFGTRNVAEAALESGACSLVNISTDKAVNPRNYMGLSKKLTELCIQELALKVAQGAPRPETPSKGTRFSNVRLGNVAGSTGSVLRLFREQIQKGGPVRVTDRRATRYFMSAAEAVHLILRAAALGERGETFGADMGEPLNIYELAKKMILFSGLKPEEDVPIEFIGLQKGEKISEELWEKSERPVPMSPDRVFVVREANARARGVIGRIKKMEEFVTRSDNEGLLRYVNQLFPEFGESRTDGVRPPMKASEIAAVRPSLGVA
jgi:FlaA1/EpsC-like NDP-sugar epimerase